LISNGGELPELPEGVYECFAVLKRPDLTVGEVQTNTNRVRILPKERKSATYTSKRESGVVPDQADAFRRAREHAKSQGMNVSELRLVTQNADAWVFRTEPNAKAAVFFTFTVSKTTGDVTMKREEAADAPSPKGGKHR
jgi:DUF4097 and DUF4098 domain-containing protein YvlB